MTPHNSAKAGDYADSVLLPGDPLRAKWIAETFFEAPRLVNSVRNCLGYSGTWKGTPVSVQATGMGQPSTAIYAHELVAVYGVSTLIRVGTCGGLNTEVRLRDLVLAATASSDSTIVRDGFGPFAYAPGADFGLLAEAARLAETHGMRRHVGAVVSSDVFYQPEGIEAYRTLMAHGVLGVEMEAAALYTVAARLKARALAICTMTDCLVTGEEIDAEARQTSLTDMVTLALDLAISQHETA